MKSLLDLFKQFTPDEHFDAIRIGIASPEPVTASTERPSDCSSLTSTRNDAGTSGSSMGSPLTIAS